MYLSVLTVSSVGGKGEAKNIYFFYSVQQSLFMTTLRNTLSILAGAEQEGPIADAAGNRSNQTVLACCSTPHSNHYESPAAKKRCPRSWHV